MTIEERVTRLERAARRWKLAAVGALVVAGAAGARKGPDVVIAEGFAVKQGDRLIGTFGATPDGNPALALFDAGGKVRARLAVGQDDSCALSLFGPDGRQRLALAAGDAGAAQAVVLDGKGRQRVFLGLDDDHPPRVAVYDEKGKHVAVMPSGRTP